MDLSEKICVYALHNKKATMKNMDGRKKKMIKKENEDYILYFVGNTLIFSENKKTGETIYY